MLKQYTVKGASNIGSFEILKSMLDKHYGVNAAGLTRDDNQFTYAVDDGEDESFAATKAAAVGQTSCIPTGLQVDVVVGSLLNVSETFTADGDETKYVLVTVVIDNATDNLELVAYTKTDLAYGPLPPGKTHAYNLKEYSIAPAGDALEEVKTWL